jgi:hypothetical protein
MTDRNFYVFRSEWRIDAPPDDVYLALEELRRYPDWWREVRQVTQLDEDTAEIRCRATLPYDLVFLSSQSVRNRGGGVLEAKLAGDLDGFSRWTITADGSGTLAVFDEEVVATKRLLQVLAPVARPVFRANHELMMRHGQQGLRTYVSGVSLGRGHPEPPE